MNNPSDNNRHASVDSHALGRRWTKQEDSLFNRVFDSTATENEKVRVRFKKRRWTKQEDELLCLCYALHRNEWSVIAEYMQGRSPRSCRERWAIITVNWSQEEIEKLEKNVEKYGENWKQVAKDLPGKTYRQVKAAKQKIE
ncbi:7635_t:CDS:2 [Paraglomus occultum]|uniref:7635_t:CDS:1 n=1 Tax=Paraglomus occultum TaxID=144539 RepID=A0A9N9CMD4_9GLOM|nr:7635_t:CDS:2 [Paraglomus occultum]